ncbi:putative transcriptional regulator protein YobU [Paenibacillus marchantiophytorum]|uniref:Transcriptional regulator protein YobU n=1 Tax=Paenibacillus marchantiophytorum TaxID=1619310 RepID=A0ABQ1FCL6_9BACL|nr:GyrI-like domain-containing protein [Paenibacillus marchantiophytorum]GGA06189.1 putative transcriptional regulator protein YobU [Paenibacillus marchantiophytorum]
MTTYTINKPAIQLTGVSVRTTNAEEMGPNGRLPQLWESYFGSQIAAQLPTNNGNLIYALYTDYESDATGAYTVIIGHETAEGAMQGEPIFTSALVPESKFLVFTSEKGPVYEVVGQAWAGIWAYFQESEEVRTFTGDYELYDSRNFDPMNTQVQIYIAIK